MYVSVFLHVVYIHNTRTYSFLRHECVECYQKNDDTCKVRSKCDVIHLSYTFSFTGAFIWCHSIWSGFFHPSQLIYYRPKSVSILCVCVFVRSTIASRLSSFFSLLFACQSNLSYHICRFHFNVGMFIFMCHQSLSCIRVQSFIIHLRGKQIDIEKIDEASVIRKFIETLDACKEIR